MKKLFFLILGILIILGSNFVSLVSASATVIKNHDCIEAEMNGAGEDFAHIKIGVKALLAGPFNPNTGRMTHDLFYKGYLPEQFGDTNFFDWYWPKQRKWVDLVSCPAPQINVDLMVDFIQVILVNDQYNPTEMHWRLARLDTNGLIRDISGTRLYLKFFVPENKDYYVIVVHRNHNAVMSSIPIRGSAGQITTYDFTSDVNKIWGGYYAATQIAGKWCLIPGDGAGSYQNGWDFGKGDNFTDISDEMASTNDTIRGKKGYYDTDYDLNGVVNTADVELAVLYWAWGSAVPFEIPTGDPWPRTSVRKTVDYNMDKVINAFDKNYQRYAEQYPFVFPVSLDMNRDGVFDVEDRVLATSSVTGGGDNLLLPTYRLQGKVVAVANDSITATVYLRATGERFEYKNSQYVIRIDTAQFAPNGISITGDMNYNSPVVPPSGIISILASVPNNGTIVIADSGDGTQIMRMVIRGQRRSGNSPELITWRNSPINPYTKVFAVVDSFIVDITTPATHTFINTTTGVGGESFRADEYSLLQNYPNPFNPNTTIAFSLPKESMVELRVFDLTGKEVVRLAEKKMRGGYHEVYFNASSLASGVYFYMLDAGEFVKIRKMVLIK